MRAVVVNTFETCREMLVDHTNQVIDRPTLYTFHGLISSTQGFTIGSSPYDDSCKKRRKAAATALAKPAMRKYLPMFDLETYCVIRDYRKRAMSEDMKEIEFNPRPFLQRFALNTTLTLCYGIRMDDAYDELLREILCIRSYM
jgi:phenylacetate 2-hydroxylase